MKKGQAFAEACPVGDKELLLKSAFRRNHYCTSNLIFQHLNSTIACQGPPQTDHQKAKPGSLNANKREVAMNKSKITMTKVQDYKGKKVKPPFCDVHNRYMVRQGKSKRELAEFRVGINPRKKKLQALNVRKVNNRNNGRKK